MKARVRFIMGAALASLLITAVPSFAQYPFPTGASLAVTGEVRAGECVVVSGGGFKANSTVTVRLNGVVTGTETANAEGNFFSEVCIPSNLAGQRITITATGVDPSGAERVMTFTANALAATGSDSRSLLYAALALMLAGGALFGLGKRRALARA